MKALVDAPESCLSRPEFPLRPERMPQVTANWNDPIWFVLSSVLKLTTDILFAPTISIAAFIPCMACIVEQLRNFPSRLGISDTIQEEERQRLQFTRCLFVVVLFVRPLLQAF